MKNKCVVGKKVKISKKAEILGDCRFCDGCKILGNCHLEDVVLEEGVVVKDSHIAGSHICKNAQVGPFANIRAGCVVGEECRIGAFVELKNAILARGCKVAHLSYIGDATLGENVNVGCGVVFANFDGKEKHSAKVGSNVFIGCNVNIVSPVEIADCTYICAGTTVTKNTERGDFVIGRVRQENKPRKI